MCLLVFDCTSLSVNMCEYETKATKDKRTATYKTKYNDFHENLHNRNGLKMCANVA